MREQREDRPLSTADMAAAAEREARGEPPNGQGDRRPGQQPGGREHERMERARPLFAEREAQELWTRWDAIQTGFVDEPRRAVEKADQLVARVIKHLAETFAEERRGLEEQWSRGDDVSTEDLRVSLQRYRSFFDRLLSM